MFLQKAINSEMEELQQERGEVGYSGDITPAKQIKIIAEAKGKRKRTCILGNSVCRPPLPRSGVTATFRAYEEIQQELNRNKKEIEKVNEHRQRVREEADAFRREMTANFKALEEHVRLATDSAPQPAQNSTHELFSDNIINCLNCCWNLYLGEMFGMGCSMKFVKM